MGVLVCGFIGIQVQDVYFMFLDDINHESENNC